MQNKNYGGDSELAVGLLLGPDGRDYMVNLKSPPPSWALPMDLRYIGVMGIRGAWWIGHRGL